jgi:uncharacterized membrane protein
MANQSPQRLVDLLEARQLGRRVPRSKFEGAMESKFNSQVSAMITFPKLTSFLLRSIFFLSLSGWVAIPH